MIRLLIPAIFLFPIFLAACEPNSSRDSVRKSDLVGSKWKLIKLTQNSEIVPFDADTAPSLEFRDDLIGGSSGCNSYRVGWQLGRDGRFAPSGPIAQTRMLCLDSVMAAERSFTAVLAESHTLVLDGEILVLKSAVGELIFEDDK